MYLKTLMGSSIAYVRRFSRKTRNRNRQHSAILSGMMRIITVLLLAIAENCAILSSLMDISAPARAAFIAVSAAMLPIAFALSARDAKARKKPESTPRLRALGKAYGHIFLFNACALAGLASNVAGAIAFVPRGLAWWELAVNAAVCLLFSLALLAAGLLRAFFASLQLGIKWRVLIFAFWWVPILNIALALKVLHRIGNEYEFETAKNELNATRATSTICGTKYPILMVHGVFFRDFRYFNYWGRIPGELKKNGASVYYGEQQSAASVADSAKELAGRITRLVAETGCEKVHVIAHSKGGLDARYAVSRLGMDRYVASLTTVGTPHAGCVFADRLLELLPEWIVRGVAWHYNSAMKRLGDANPDFLSAVRDLTASRCAVINGETPDKDGVMYRSVASKMIHWSGGKFPLNLSHILIKGFDGENDGLVSVESASRGENSVLIVPPHARGISHADLIDLNRENIDGFDVRELYVALVSDLRAMGL